MSDMPVRDSDVRFRGQSGHPLGLDECLLMTHSGHRPHSVTAYHSFWNASEICANIKAQPRTIECSLPKGA
jgi:hypothetical protein